MKHKYAIEFKVTVSEDDQTVELPSKDDDDIYVMALFKLEWDKSPAALDWLLELFEQVSDRYESRPDQELRYIYYVDGKDLFSGRIKVSDFLANKTGLTEQLLNFLESQTPKEIDSL